MQKNDLLLVTDMQNVYKKNGKWECLSTVQAAQNINLIINSGAKNVIFTKFIANEKNPQGVWKNYNQTYANVNSDFFANQMIQELSDSARKFPVYTKSVYSSLAIPEVLESAKKSNRVVITGVVAECCVLSTVFALIDEGIYTIYLSDAVSGLTKEKEDATELVLSGLSPLHVKIMSTKEYLSELPAVTNFQR